VFFAPPILKTGRKDCSEKALERHRGRLRSGFLDPTRIMPCKISARARRHLTDTHSGVAPTVEGPGVS